MRFKGNKRSGAVQFAGFNSSWIWLSEYSRKLDLPSAAVLYEETFTEPSIPESHITMYLEL